MSRFNQPGVGRLFRGAGMGYLSIRNFGWILALLGALIPTASRAQVVINMSP